MSAGVFVGRVGGIAVALGVGLAIAHGAAVASADSLSADTGPGHTTRSAAAVKPAASVSSARGRAIAAQAPAIAKPAGTAKSKPSANAVSDPLAPDPKATVSTPFGDLGKWMINKKGDVADWVGIPYCSGDVCKTMQEPINTVFTVQARSKFQAEAKLNRTLRRAGFPPSCCSSVGYQGIVDQITSQQMPRGGILGIGALGPGFIERGLLNLILGIGPAYRDASFLAANSHLRTFGGVADGNGNYIFTASVSKESLGPGLTHAYESFDQARAKLLSDMLATGARNLGVVDMRNAIPADDPTYSTGDHDGYAQVIGINVLAGMAWRQPTAG